MSLNIVFLYIYIQDRNSTRLVYMCAKLPFKVLNIGLCPPHLTNIYTREVTVALKMCGTSEFEYIINIKILQQNY